MSSMRRDTFGIVEGFFSSPLRPWTHRERRETIEFVSRNAARINCYFYCPKNDPRVTQQWSRRYGSRDAHELRRFTKRCRELGLSTIYGLNPLLDGLDPADPATKVRWLRAVTKKIDHVLALGFDGICLLFDDIPIAYDVADNAPLALSHGEEMMIELVNEVYARFRGRVATFWFCGPDYCFRRASSLTRGLRCLHRDIGVIWTGNEIFVKNISAGDLARVKRLLGKDRTVLFWLNYPVNDCEQALGSFNLGAVPSPRFDVLKRLGAVLVNPMRECRANFPVYVSLSELAASPQRYRRDVAWHRSLETLFGDRAAAAQLLIDNFATRSIVDAGAPSLLQKLRSDASVRRVIAEIRTALGEIRRPGLGRDARGFCATIEQVLKNAEWFVEMGEAMLGGRPVSVGELRRRDWFPTNVSQPRYAPEIVRILSQRLKALGAADRRVKLGKQEIAAIKSFGKRSAGQQKLALRASEGARIAKMVQRLVRREQEAVCLFLNEAHRPVVERVRGYFARSACSRFTLP